MFQEYKNIEHNGNMLMADQRTKIYEDRSKVIAEMADTFYIFSRSIFFNPEMAEQYNHSCDKYINYFTQIVQNIDIFLQEDQLMHTKAGFSQVPVPGYLPSSYDLEQTDTDQIIQTANEEVASTDKEMQVIIQSDNKHPHINKTGSFSRLRSFKLNDMGFSLNRISPIMFNVENQQTPANCGTKGRALTLMPREKKVPQNAQQGQTYDEVENMNEAHHEPQGGASYNPDESVTNKYTFQNVQGRFIPPKVSNMPTQPQQQQQSSSEEGSKETTILNEPRHQKEMGAQIILQAQQTACHKDQPLQHLHIHHKLEDHHRLPQSTIRMLRDVKHVTIINICPKITRIYQNAMEPPMDPPEHLENLVKVQDPLKGRARCQNLTLEHHQAQVLLHNLLDHLKTQ